MQNAIPDSIKTLYNLRLNYPKNVIISYININSIRNKLQDIDLLLNGKVDVLTIAETKLDNSFPEAQFCLEGYKKPFRLDDTRNSGGLLVYVNNNIPSRRLHLFNFASDIQIIPIELNFRKQKWLILSIYRPPKQNFLYFLTNLTEAVDFYSRNYENILINGDFNAEPQDAKMKTFLDANTLHSHHNIKTCWKSAKGTCIDLILSNKKFSLQHTGASEIGVSDFHLLIYTMLKSTFVKLPPKRLLYRCYKRFDRNYFLYDLEYSLKECDTTEYREYEATFAGVLDRHAPLKIKILRGNNRPHVSKHLRKEIMKRSRFKNIATRSQKPEDWASYRIQRNLVVNINKKAKKTLFNSVDINSSQGSKAFWKTCKPFFSNKGSIVEERILLVENETIVSDDRELSTIFNKYFNTITNGLNIFKWNDKFNSSSVEATAIAIEKYADHPSILMIKERFQIDKTFEFKEISTHDTYSEILKLNRRKNVSGNIPINILQLATREVPHVSVALTQCFNNSIESCIFPDELTWAEIVPIHKKDSTTDKSNYRPISLLPTISKVFEKIVFKQLTEFLDQKLSKFLCGFRKQYSTQHALVNLIQNWQRALDSSDKVGAVLMDLSKAFDCLPHDLLTHC